MRTANGFYFGAVLGAVFAFFMVESYVWAKDSPDSNDTPDNTENSQDPQDTHEASSLPPLPLPLPTGPNRVGVTTWHWIDPERPDPYASTKTSVMEMMVHAWYPASPAPDAKPAPYRPLARNDHDVVVKTSVAGAPFLDLDKPAPIILLCPGRGTFAEYNTSLAEEFASRGYAVFSIDSLYTGRVTFPDGREVSPLAKFGPSFELMTGPYKKVDAFFEEAVELSAGDVYFVLEQIANLHENDPAGRFTGKLDLSTVGIYGHSLGGRICGDVAGRRSSIRAFAAMEAVPPRKIRRAGLDAAVMMMYSSDLPEDIALPNMEEIIPKRRSDVFFIRFEGLGHNSSTDIPLLSGGGGYEASPEEGLRLTRLALVNFFDAYLKEEREFPSKQLTGEPRITIRAHPAPTSK